jgi:hypothetical protein
MILKVNRRSHGGFFVGQDLKSILNFQESGPRNNNDRAKIINQTERFGSIQMKIVTQSIASG